MKTKLFLISLLAFTVSACIPQSAPSIASISTATLRGQDIAITMAVTAEEQAKGLGGVKSLTDSEGMLFPFETSEIRSFWMKNMVMPIDIIWINDGKVVGFEQNVPFEPLETSNAALPKYRPLEPIDTVLEVAAGFVERYAVAIADSVQYR